MCNNIISSFKLEILIQNNKILQITIDRNEISHAIASLCLENYYSIFLLYFSLILRDTCAILAKTRKSSAADLSCPGSTSMKKKGNRRGIGSKGTSGIERGGRARKPAPVARGYESTT